MSDDTYPPEDDIVQTAIDTHCDDEVNIDAGAEVSYGDTGAWVQAWVYVAYTNVEGD